MTALDDIRTIDFLGIGGIGMSALARYFHERGVQVTGYDRTPSALTRQLEAEGIALRYEAGAPGGSAPALVVYTPAIPASDPWLTACRQQHVPVMKRSEVLGLVTREMYSIAIAGTHGKTTVSALVAHILRESGYGCNAFLGGIALNYGTNYWSSPRQVAVVEADEYDRSFLALSPATAVVTAMDPDHLDIYGTATAMQDAYVAFTGLLGAGGLLIYKLGLPRTGEMGGGKKLSYSLSDPAADCRTEALRIEEGAYQFTVAVPGERLGELSLAIGGRHNVENAVAAVAVAHSLGIETAAIRSALASFRGTRRRFEYVVRTPGRIYIDDYAHHPQELRALIASVRELFGDRRCTLIFQPHLFSRTRDLADEFARALDEADEVILLPVYPAREAPLPGVDSGLIASRMHRASVRLLSMAEALAAIALDPPALLVTAGAGDIDRVVEKMGVLMGGTPAAEETSGSPEGKHHEKNKRS